MVGFQANRLADHVDRFRRPFIILDGHRYRISLHKAVMPEQRHLSDQSGQSVPFHGLIIQCDDLLQAVQDRPDRMPIDLQKAFADQGLAMSLPHEDEQPLLEPEAFQRQRSLVMDHRGSIDPGVTVTHRGDDLLKPDHDIFI